MSRRLLARRRVDPTWLSHPFWVGGAGDGHLTVETYGPEVAEIAALAGFAPDPEQELILDLLFALGPNGKSAVYEADIIGPRQNFKTGVIKQAELGWLFVTQERLVVHSAHELSTTEEAFNDLRTLIENTPALSRRLDVRKGKNPGVSEGNGRWALHLLDDDGLPIRIKYKARTKGGGRGLTGYKVVLDEGFALQPSHLGSLEPTLAAVPDPQLLTASSAGRLDSAVLRDKRERGRAGKSPRQMYVEYGDPDAWKGCLREDCTHAKDAVGCAADDEERWARIQPALGRRVQRETIRAMRQSMPVEEFLYEFMVWWEDPPNADASVVIDLKVWGTLVNPKAKPPARACVVLDVSPDRKQSSIGVAGAGRKGRTLVMTHTAAGTDWVVPKLVKLVAKRDIVEVALHPQSQASVLIPELMAAGIEFTTLNNGEMGQACAAWIEAVHAKKPQIEHVGQVEFDTATANARTRLVGQQVEMWDRKNRTIHITALVAGSTAAHRWSLLEADDYDVMDSIG